MTYTDHPDYQALLRSVAADPAADLPRLVIADWLDDLKRAVLAWARELAVVTAAK